MVPFQNVVNLIASMDHYYMLNWNFDDGNVEIVTN